MATVERVIEMVRDRIDESTERQWTDRQLRTFIIEGARDMARKSKQLTDFTTVTVIADTGEYTVTSSVLEIHAAYWTPTGETRKVPLVPKAYNAMDQVWSVERDSARSSDPTFFTVWGFPPQLKLRLWPTTLTGGTVQLLVSRLPTEFDLDGADDADVLDVPEGWPDLIVDYAEFTALRKDRDARWQEAKALYDEKLNSLIELGDAMTQGGEIVFDGAGAGFLPSWLTSMDGGW